MYSSCAMVKKGRLFKNCIIHESQLIWLYYEKSNYPSMIRGRLSEENWKIFRELYILQGLVEELAFV